MLDKQTDLRIDFEEIEEENNQIFGEFDPEEFEILDEVGEDDEMLEEMTHNRKSDEQSSDMNQDYPTLLRTPVNFLDINKSTIDGTNAEATNKSIIKLCQIEIDCSWMIEVEEYDGQNPSDFHLLI